MRIRTGAWKLLTELQREEARDYMEYYPIVKICLMCKRVYGLNKLDKNNLCSKCSRIKKKDRPDYISINEKIVAHKRPKSLGKHPRRPYET